jgi:hypothetical protein
MVVAEIIIDEHAVVITFPFLIYLMDQLLDFPMYHLIIHNSHFYFNK